MDLVELCVGWGTWRMRGGDGCEYILFLPEHQRSWVTK